MASFLFIGERSDAILKGEKEKIMEPWWFLEPLLYTAFIFSFIGFVVSYLYDKATDGMSFVPSVIAMISMIPIIIWVLLAGLWLISWLLWAIWSPFV